jgi:hypothetical protein
MKTAELMEKYGIEADSAEFMADLLDMDLTGHAKLDKPFALRAAKASLPVFNFTAHIEARCTVWDLFERSAQPIVINWQNSHRQGRKETLEAANKRLEALPKGIPLEIKALNEREQKEINIDSVVSKVSATQAADMIKQLEAKLRAMGIDPNAQR